MTMTMTMSSPGIESFWAFANARWDLLVTGETKDPILQKYRFTNCHRWCDRVSQYLLSQVLPGLNDGPYQGIHLIWRLSLFKTFNRIGTWEKLDRAGLCDLPSSPGMVGAYLREIGDCLADGVCFSPAYRMCIGRSTYGFKEKHRNWVFAAWSVAEKYQSLLRATRVRDLYTELVQLPMFGRFLAMQFATDIRYVTGAKENSFVIAGPGSRRGIHMMHEDLRDRMVIVNGEDTMYAERIYRVWESQNGMFDGPKLELMDIQNLFCEYDKYSRIRWPEIQLIAKEKKRPKQNYTPSPRGRMKWPADFVEPRHG